MKTQILFIALLMVSASIVNGQTVIVNPDGTHTVAFIPESSTGVGVVVNPDGTHSIVQKVGSIAIVIGGSGMHRTVTNTAPCDRNTSFWRPKNRNTVVRSTTPHRLFVDHRGNHILVVQHAQAAMLLIPSFAL